MQGSIIDAWGQHPTERWLKEPSFASLQRWGAYPKEVEMSLKVSTTLAVMDAAGVGRMCLTAWSGPQGDLISNEEVAACVREAPDRFVGIASVDLRKPVEAVEEIKKMHSLGFKGVRVLPWLWDLPPNHARYYPIYTVCSQLGIPFCLQIGHTGPLMPSDVGRPVLMDRVCIDFPDLKVVGGHIGYPWTEEAIAVATKHRNFYIDTSAYTCKRYPKQLVEFMNSHGRHKVLFGSNYPMVTPAKCLEELSSLALDREAEQHFLHGNAARVFNLSPSQSKSRL